MVVIQWGERIEHASSGGTSRQKQSSSKDKKLPSDQELGDGVWRKTFLHRYPRRFRSFKLKQNMAPKCKSGLLLLNANSTKALQRESVVVAIHRRPLNEKMKT